MLTSTPTLQDMTDAECSLWRDLIQRECGLTFPESRLSFLQDRLTQRMRERGLRSFSDYYHHVLFNDHGADEWRSLLALLLNHESSFFRHAPSFAAVTEYVLPRLLSRKQDTSNHDPESRTVRVWSAACSAGQEAYSLAMCFHEAFRLNANLVHLGPASRWKFSVLGTDIGTRILQHAQRAAYRAHELRGLDPALCQKFFRPIDYLGGRAYQVNDSLRREVEFQELNLLNVDAASDVSGRKFDLIFCQNVLIYFSSADRVRIATGLSQRLSIGGFLCLGPADWMGQPISGLDLVPGTEAALFQRRL